MPRYNSSFYAVGNPGDFSPSAWERYFSPFNPDLWTQDKGGAIMYFADNGDRFSLVVEYSPDHGMAFGYDVDNLTDEDRPVLGFTSAFAPDKMDTFIVLDNGGTQPLGAFVPPDQCWPIVSAFLSDPTKLPDDSLFIDSDDINWPEDY